MADIADIEAVQRRQRSTILRVYNMYRIVLSFLLLFSFGVPAFLLFDQGLNVIYETH